jgi:hypothetical protein
LRGHCFRIHSFKSSRPPQPSSFALPSSAEALQGCRQPFFDLMTKMSKSDFFHFCRYCRGHYRASLGPRDSAYFTLGLPGSRQLQRRGLDWSLTRYAASSFTLKRLFPVEGRAIRHFFRQPCVMGPTCCLGWPVAPGCLAWASTWHI